MAIICVYSPPDPKELKFLDKLFILNGLVDAAEMIQATYGTIYVPWGVVHRIARGSGEFSVSGGSREAQSLMPVHIDRVENSRGYCESGSAFIMIVELAEPVEALSAMPLGPTDDSESPQCDDSTELNRDDQLKPAWFSLDDVIANRESVKVIEF